MFGIEQLTTSVNGLSRETKLLRLTVAEHTSALQSLTAVLRRFLGPPSPTGKLIFVLQGEQEMGLVYDVTLPALPEVPEAADVIGGRLSLKFDGVDQPVIETAVGQKFVNGVIVAQGAIVDVSFSFVDDAGNVSVNPLVLPTFTATDTIPPPDAVDGLAVTLIGEQA